MKPIDLTPLIDRLAPHAEPGWRDEVEALYRRDDAEAWPTFAVWLMRRLPGAHAARVAGLYERVLRGDDPTAEEWWDAYAAAAAYAAYAAANAAANAAAAAAHADYAAAAYAAAYAYAADYAAANAYAADYAAANAANTAAYHEQAAALLRVLRCDLSLLHEQIVDGETEGST